MQLPLSALNCVPLGQYAAHTNNNQFLSVFTCQHVRCYSTDRVCIVKIFNTNLVLHITSKEQVPVAYPGILFGGKGFQQIQWRIEGRENGDLGAVAPESGVPLNLQMSETRILIKLLRMYFPRNLEFGSALSILRNFGGGGGGLNPNPPLGTPLTST
jgi:hypothetical protein